MKSNIAERLQQIVEQLAPEFQQQGRQDMASLLQAGVRTDGDLLKLIQDQAVNTDIRCTACWIAARLSDPQAVSALVAALSDPQPALRAQAAQSLSELGNKKSIPALLNTLLNDQEQEVRTAAAYAFGFLGDGEEHVTRALLGVLSNQGESAGVRGQAAEALGYRGDQQAVLPLIAALDDAAVEVRYWAVFALGHLRDPVALAALEHLAATDQAVLEGWGPINQEAREAIQSIRERQERREEL